MSDSELAFALQERIEELEAALTRTKNDPGLFFTGDRDILEQNQKIKADVDYAKSQLRKQYNRAEANLEMAKEYEAENARLLAALKRIVDYYDSYGEYAKVCAEIAREALAEVKERGSE